MIIIYNNNLLLRTIQIYCDSERNKDIHEIITNGSVQKITTAYSYIL